MSLNHSATIIKQRSPGFFRGIMMAPVEKRPFLIALLALDMELWAVANASSEEMIVTIKLAWWQDALVRLPESQGDHEVLSSLAEADVPVTLALEILNCYQNSKDSFPLIIRIFSEHLAANYEHMKALQEAIATKRHRQKKWPQNARPIVMMLLPLSRLGALWLALTGWA